MRSQLRARAAALGWALDTSDPFAGLHLMVDGVRAEPATRRLAARFHVPAGTARPSEVDGSTDNRELGVCVDGLMVDDGFVAPRALDLADPLLCAGFHALGEGARRWTAGRARLPAALWARYEGADGFFLRVELAGPALPRWRAPTCAEGDVVALRHVG